MILLKYLSKNLDKYRLKNIILFTTEIVDNLNKYIYNSITMSNEKILIF